MDIDILYKRIRDRRVELDMTQDELARKVGYKTKSSINKIELGQNDISQSKIYEFAKALKTTPAYLMGWNDNVEKIDHPADTFKIPVYGSVPAGIPLEAIEEIDSYIEIPVSLLKGGKEYASLKVKGDSMYPKYFEGDIIVIELTPDCNNGDDAVVYVNGYDATLKQVHKNDDGSITLIPFNREYPPKTYGKKDDEISILGVVKELRRKV